MAFKRAEKSQSKLRLAVSGAAGAGKTYSSLAIATGLGARVAVIDTERGSASKYADVFSFDAQELQTFHPERYIEAIREAEAGRYDVIVIDSLSHAWAGSGGVLEIVDGAAERSRSGAGRDTWAGWKTATPIQNRLIDTILSRPHPEDAMYFITDLAELDSTKPLPECPRCDAEALEVHPFHVHCLDCDFVDVLDAPAYLDDEAFEVGLLDGDDLSDLDLEDFDDNGPDLDDELDLEGQAAA